MAEPGLPEDLTPRSWKELSARTGRAEKPALLVNAVGMGILSNPHELRIALEDTWTPRNGQDVPRPPNCG